jgi:hypothetical protein
MEALGVLSEYWEKLSFWQLPRNTIIPPAGVNARKKQFILPTSRNACDCPHARSLSKRNRQNRNDR